MAAANAYSTKIQIFTSKKENPVINLTSVKVISETKVIVIAYLAVPNHEHYQRVFDQNCAKIFINKSR